MCQTVILSHKGSTMISQCVDCKMLHLWHINLIMSFNPAQFNNFKSHIEKLDFNMGAVLFPDGTNRAIIYNTDPDICFGFTYSEWEDLNDALKEASYMQQVYLLMHQ